MEVNKAREVGAGCKLFHHCEDGMELGVNYANIWKRDYQQWTTIRQRDDDVSINQLFVENAEEVWNIISCYTVWLHSSSGKLLATRRHESCTVRRDNSTGVSVWVYRWFEFEIRSGYLLLANQHTSSEGQGSRDLCQTRVKPYWIEIVAHSTHFRSYFESPTVEFKTNVLRLRRELGISASRGVNTRVPG